MDKAKYEEKKGTIPEIDEYLHVFSNSYATVSGKRLFICPNLFNKTSLKLPADSIRKYDIIYKYAFEDIDSIRIKIPKGYDIESIPKDVQMNNKYGNYSISFQINGTSILCVRFHERNKARFYALDYNNVMKFTNEIYNADRSEIVFVKKEN